jgi:hypothetical protein
MSGLNFATAYIDLALRGQQGVTAALAQMRQQFQQTTSAATALRNLLSAGPGTRLAQQQLERNALMAQVRAAEAGAGARAMAAPAGQQALRQTFAAQAQAQADVLRQELAQGRARDAFEQSPQGRAAGAEVRRLREQRDEQEESRRRRSVIDEFGQLGGRMRLFKEGLGKLAPGLGVGLAAAHFVAGEMRRELDLAGRANPQGARNLGLAQESVDIQTGRNFLGLQRAETARRLRAAEQMRNEPPGALRARLRQATGYAPEDSSGMGLLRTLFPGAAERKRDQETLRRSGALEFQGPFKSRFESLEGFGEALQLAGTNTSALEGQNLQDQLKAALEAQTPLLERIADNTARNATPAWR